MTATGAGQEIASRNSEAKVPEASSDKGSRHGGTPTAPHVELLASPASPPYSSSTLVDHSWRGNVTDNQTWAILIARGPTRGTGDSFIIVHDPRMIIWYGPSGIEGLGGTEMPLPRFPHTFFIPESYCLLLGDWGSSKAGPPCKV